MYQKHGMLKWELEQIQENSKEWLKLRPEDATNLSKMHEIATKITNLEEGSNKLLKRWQNTKTGQKIKLYPVQKMDQKGQKHDQIINLC